MTDEPETLSIELPEVSIRALAWGPADGPAALCLHGYPDTAHTWRRIAPALAAGGWRVVAPFLRGYAPSGLARDGCYQVGALVHDALALRRELGPRRVVAIGHDWGAIAARAATAVDPEAFERVVTIAVPPLGPLARPRAVVDNPRIYARQVRLSWYALFQQLPVLPEALIGRVTRGLWNAWSPGYDATEDLRLLDAAWPDRAHRTAALRYYRALLAPWQRRSRYRDDQRGLLRPAGVPELYLHGERDGCLAIETARLAARALGTDDRFAEVADAGHFVQLERPDAVLAEISAFAG